VQRVVWCFPSNTQVDSLCLHTHGQPSSRILARFTLQRTHPSCRPAGWGSVLSPASTRWSGQPPLLAAFASLAKICWACSWHCPTLFPRCCLWNLVLPPLFFLWCGCTGCVWYSVGGGRHVAAASASVCCARCGWRTPPRATRGHGHETFRSFLPDVISTMPPSAAPKPLSAPFPGGSCWCRWWLLRRCGVYGSVRGPWLFLLCNKILTENLDGASVHSDGWQLSVDFSAETTALLCVVCWKQSM